MNKTYFCPNHSYLSHTGACPYCKHRQAIDALVELLVAIIDRWWRKLKRAVRRLLYGPGPTGKGPGWER